MVDEAEIEGGIVRDERRIADELEQLLAAVVETGLVGEEAVGEAVHRLGLARHRPAGVEIGVEGAAGLDPVEQSRRSRSRPRGRRRPGSGRWSRYRRRSRASFLYESAAGAEASEDMADRSPCFVEGTIGRDDEVGAFALLLVGHLVGKDAEELLRPSCPAGPWCACAGSRRRPTPPRPCRPSPPAPFRTAAEYRAPRSARRGWRRERPRARAPPPGGSAPRAGPVPRARPAPARRGCCGRRRRRPSSPENAPRSRRPARPRRPAAGAPPRRRRTPARPRRRTSAPPWTCPCRSSR